MFNPEILTSAMHRLQKRQRADRSVLFAEKKETIRLDGIDDLIHRPVTGLECGLSWYADWKGTRQFVHVDGLDVTAADRLMRRAAGIISRMPSPCVESRPTSELTTMAGFSPARERSRPCSTVRQDHRIQDHDRSPDSTLQTLLPALGHIDRGARLADTRCAAVTFSCTIVLQTIWVITDNGRLSTDDRKAIRISARVKLRTAKGPAAGTCRWGRSDDGLDFTEHSALELGRQAARSAAFAAEARQLPPVVLPVILTAGCGGILFHEACGHMLEADFVRRGRSPYRGRVGDMIASPLVTTLDDPTVPGLAGSFRIDDEGTPARKKILVEAGRLCGFLGDLRHAGTMKDVVAGNGRRRSYRYAPLPRMSNTMMRAGIDDSRQIIEETTYGLLARQISSGRVDPSTGAFRFTVSEGHLIENGRLTQPIAGVIVSGNGPETLQAIDRVGDDPMTDPAATGCDKEGQTIPVSMGHPTVRISSLKVLPP